MKEQYVIGVDFGTLSARAVVCRASDGEILSEETSAYHHAVMTASLPDGTPLPEDWALQHPKDYTDALCKSVNSAVENSGVDPALIRGISVDFTVSTPLPVDEQGVPLCFKREFASRPHAYAKLWKHHAAQKEADELTALFAEKDPEMLMLNGGRVTPECLFAKLLQILHEDEAVFHAMDRFVEAGDYVIEWLTGVPVRCLSVLRCKGFYRDGIGFPPSIEEKYPQLADVAHTKMRGVICPLTTKSGDLTPSAAEKLHLPAGIAVGVMQSDGLVALPAMGICRPGDAMLSLGTSSCLSLASERLVPVVGPCNIAYESNLPGLYGYASGQAALGDTLAWFVDHCVPEAIVQAAKEQGRSVHEELSARASLMKPGQTGLLVLDWWNGDKSRADMLSSGMILGMTLQTKTEEIYRALLEGLAFGIRRMMDAYESEGIQINTLYTGGGIPYKNPLFMQIISDVTGKQMLCSKPYPTACVGSAIMAAMAAGVYASIEDAVAHMNCLSETAYVPDMDNHRLFSAVYSEYCELTKYFSQENQVMHRLKNLAKG